MDWLVFAVLSATSFGLYNFFVKISSDKFTPSVALMLIAGTSFLVATATTAVLKMTGQPIMFTRNSVLIPVAAGLFTGVAEIFYLLMFSKSTSLSLGNPLVVGGTILVAVILGLIILREPLTAAKTAGIILTLLGLIFLARG